jgi:hypothetical protein
MGVVILESVGIVAIGVALGYAGMRLLEQYRKAFFTDPRSVMTLEVVLNIVRLGGPGYVAIVCLIGAVGLVSAGVGFLIMETAHHLGWL